MNSVISFSQDIYKHIIHLLDEKFRYYVKLSSREYHGPTLNFIQIILVLSHFPRSRNYIIWKTKSSSIRFYNLIRVIKNLYVFWKVWRMSRREEGSKKKSTLYQVCLIQYNLSRSLRNLFGEDWKSRWEIVCFPPIRFNFAILILSNSLI